MNLKERLGVEQERRLENKNVQIGLGSESDVFIADKTAENIIKKIVNDGKNIILQCAGSAEREITCNYLRKYMTYEKADIFRELSEDINYSKADRIIITEPKDKDIAVLFERMMTDYKSYVFPVNLRSYVNITESLKALIMMNKSNITERVAAHIVGVSDLAVIEITRNEDGLFEISKIEETQYDGNKLSAKVLYEKYEEIAQQTEQTDEIKYEKTLQKDEDCAKLNDIKEEPVKSINKIDLLKLKAKKKKALNQ